MNELSTTTGARPADRYGAAVGRMLDAAVEALPELLALGDGPILDLQVTLEKALRQVLRPSKKRPGPPGWSP